MSPRGDIGDTMGDCELCGATKVSIREHRVNKAMLAICQKCVVQMNLEPKQEAPVLHALVELPQENQNSLHFGKTIS